MCDAAFWNWAMVATARLVPVKILTDRAKIRAFAKKTNPVIKLVDPLIGEKVTQSNCLLWFPSIWGRNGEGGCKTGMLCSFVWNQRDWIRLISTTVVRCIVGRCMHSICHSVSSVRGLTPVYSSHHCCHVSQLLLDAGWHACGFGA